jgi:hypothetical protein
METPCVIVARMTKGGYTYRIDTILYKDKHILAKDRGMQTGEWVYEEFIDGEWMYRKTNKEGVPINGFTDNSWFLTPKE